MSMTNLRARLLCSFYASGYNGDAKLPIDLSLLNEYDFDANGTSLNSAASLFIREEYAIAHSTTQTMNFSNSSLSDQLGDVLDLSAIRGVLIVNSGTVNLTLGGTCPIVTAGMIVQVDSAYMVTTPSVAGYAASAGVAGTITIQNTSGSTAGEYSIAVVGY